MPWLAIAPAVLIAGAGGFAAGRLFHTAPPALATVSSFQQLTDRAGLETSPTLSPDGKTVVYVSDSGGDADLYSLRIGARTAVLLTPDSPADDVQPAFSPDGERIAFRSSRDGGGIFGLWLDDNRRALMRDAHGIAIVDTETGVRRPLLAVRGYVVGRSVGVSRDLRWITYTETGTEGDIWLAELPRR